ncbi:MAG: hypothetical protein PQJ60_05080, partial [Spirochaetales bacterium]|nr:hypothetical protein [Spirochaetales bacterium]
SWLEENCNLEVLKTEVDDSGYDIVLCANKIIRHVQLKSSFIGSKTSRQKIHIELTEKPSGCVIWIFFNKNNLNLGPFYFLGNEPGKQLRRLDEFKIAKHTKGNSKGEKLERPNFRVLNKGSFTKYDSFDSLYLALFGNSL